jgi:HAMP domain-containing protein
MNEQPKAQDDKIVKNKIAAHDLEFKKLITYTEASNLHLIQLQKEFNEYKRKTNNEITELKKAINTLRAYLRTNG